MSTNIPLVRQAMTAPPNRVVQPRSLCHPVEYFVRDQVLTMLWPSLVPLCFPILGFSVLSKFYIVDKFIIRKSKCRCMSKFFLYLFLRHVFMGPWTLVPSASTIQAPIAGLCTGPGLEFTYQPSLSHTLYKDHIYNSYVYNQRVHDLDS